MDRPSTPPVDEDEPAVGLPGREMDPRGLLWDEEPGMGVVGWEELAGGVELPEGVGWAPRRRVRPSDIVRQGIASFSRSRVVGWLYLVRFRLVLSCWFGP